MIHNIKNEYTRKIAEYLLKIKAVQLNPKNPYTWASGWKSPIYCDNRKTLSYPEVRNCIAKAFEVVLKSYFETPEIIAGVATGGIAHGMILAQNINLPFIYVKSEPKKHGLSNQIEGDLQHFKNIMVIEDLISTAKSSINAIDALKLIDCKVLGMMSIFNYEFDIAIENLHEINCKTLSLCSYSTLVEVAIEKNYVSSSDLSNLQEWRKNPSAWGK